MRYKFLVFMILYFPFTFTQRGDMYNRIDTKLVDGKFISVLQDSVIDIPVSSRLISPQIVRWSQSFEDPLFPPAGWLINDPIPSSTQKWERYTTTPIFGKASASVRYETGVPTMSNNDWLITHNFIVNTGDVFVFWGKGSLTTFNDSLEILYTTDDNLRPEDFTRIACFKVSLPSEYRIPLSFLSGKNVRLAFHYKEKDQYRAFVDSVYVASSPANDAAVIRINVNKDNPSGIIKPEVQVKNYGFLQNPITVKVKIKPGNYESVKIIGNVAQLEDSSIVFDEWKAEKGEYTVFASVAVANDEFAENDTLTKRIKVSDVLYDNGPYYNYKGVVWDGSDGSILESPLNFYGYTNSGYNGYRVSDEFTIPNGYVWKIDGFTFYAYQYGANPSNPPFTGINYRIWKGRPGLPGSIIVYGDVVTNKFVSSTWIEAYRYYENGFNAFRPIFALDAAANVKLNSGSYWIDWQVISSDIAWVPPIVFKGQPVTGDAYQFDGVWNPIKDSVSFIPGSFRQGLPFRVKGLDSLIAIPVELSAFTADCVDGGILLKWSTATETNNCGFKVERKTGNEEFKEIYSTTGAGSSTKVNYYSYLDNPGNGLFTYRLKQVDYNGTLSYSSQIQINSANKYSFNLAQNFPNPFNPSTVIKFTLPNEADVNLRIYNILGEEVFGIVKPNLTAGQHSIQINALSLNSGVYFYSMIAKTANMGTFKMVKKMIVAK